MFKFRFQNVNLTINNFEHSISLIFFVHQKPYIHTNLAYWLLTYIRNVDLNCLFLVEPFIVLNGGHNENEGRVEIYKKGKWGTLCGRFGHIEAAYICRHLGYMGGNSAGHGYFGAGSGMFWRINASCLYTRQCDIVKPVLYPDNCDHEQDFAVMCGMFTPFFQIFF